MFAYLVNCVVVAALCPEEAESALEATHFFTEDEQRGDHTCTHTLLPAISLCPLESIK